MSKKRHEKDIDCLDMVASIIAEMIENYEMQLENEDNQDNEDLEAVA